MGKKPDISMDSPEKARERFEKAVDAAMTSGPRPSNHDARLQVTKSRLQGFQKRSGIAPQD